MCVSIGGWRAARRKGLQRFTITNRNRADIRRTVPRARWVDQARVAKYKQSLYIHQGQFGND
jgi:hypothetical protein